MENIQANLLETIDNSNRSARLLKYSNNCRLQGFLNDITIKVGNEVFAANRMVLACYSQFFESMFRSRMKEQYQDEVEIKKCEGKCVKMLLEFMYTDKLAIDNENVLSLLATSDYLQIDDAKQLCFDFLRKALATDNCFTILSAADLYGNEAIKSHVFQFITANLDRLIISIEFNNLEKDILVSNFGKLFLFGANPVTLYEGVVRWTKHDMRARSSCFPVLFDKLQLEQLPTDFLKNVVLKEKLVKENLSSYKKATEALMQILKGNMAEDKSKLVTLGGQETSTKVLEVLNTSGDHPSQSSFPDLPMSLCAFVTVAHNDVVYCMGGCIECSTSNFSNKVFSLDLNESDLKWKERAPMHRRKCDLAAAVFQGHVVTTGCWDNGSKPFVDSYIATLDKWIDLSPMRRSRSGHELVVCNNLLYAIGGKDEKGNFLSSVEQLSSLDGTWKKATPMQYSRSFFVSVNCKGSIYALGGCRKYVTSPPTETVEKFDPSQNKWVFASSMNVERYDHAACVLRGKIYVVGGMNAQGNVKEIECYNPANDMWSVVCKSEYELHRHTVIAV